MARVARERSDAEHGVGLGGEQRLEQVREVLGVILEVGVEDRGEITTRVPKSRADRGALAAVAIVEQDRHVVRPVARAEELAAPIGRAVVHHDQLDRRGKPRLHYLVNRLLHGGDLVIDRHQDRHCLGQPRPSGQVFGLLSVQGRRSVAVGTASETRSTAPCELWRLTVN